MKITWHTVRTRKTAGRLTASTAAFALAGLLTVLANSGAGSEPDAGNETEPDPMAPLRMLLGTWEGEIDGKLGKGTGIRRYELLSGDQFVVGRHRSIRMPQERSPEGDQHEELAVFTFDREQETIVYREFMPIEGIVIRSTCDVEGNRIVCTSVAVENGPGIRTRLTLDLADRYRFTEIYEIAWRGEELEHYFTNQWRRSPASFD